MRSKGDTDISRYKSLDFQESVMVRDSPEWYSHENDKDEAVLATNDLFSNKRTIEFHFSLSFLEHCPNMTAKVHINLVHVSADKKVMDH